MRFAFRYLLPLGLLLLAGCSGGKLSGVEVSPGLAQVTLGGSQQFVATVTGPSNRDVTWSVVEAGGGTITPTGLYVAPGSQGTYTVLATSNADSKLVGRATVTVVNIGGMGGGITVAVTPATPTVAPGGNLTFSASVAGTMNTAVTWSVKETGGGTIDTAGRYTAPATAGVFTVVASSAADATRKGTARVTVSGTALPVSVRINPATVTVGKGSSFLFTAIVSNSSNTAVTWTVEGSDAGGGSVDATGNFTAAATPGMAYVVATSKADPTKFARATVTVSDQPVVNVVVNPDQVELEIGAKQQFVAKVFGATDTAVTWDVDTGAGSITSAGLYTAPVTPGTYEVLVTSVENPERFALATVRVKAPQPVVVTVTPATTQVAPNGTVQLTATVTGTTNTAVTWAVTGGTAAGTVTTAGLYKAPATAGTYTVTATSVASPEKVGSAQVTVSDTTGVSVVVSPTTLSVAPNGTVQLTATVTGTTNTAVTWTATSGMVNTNGFYTAPATAGEYTVTAKSVADPTRSGTAKVTVTSGPIAVSVTPATTSVAPGGTAVFSATVTNTANKDVTWTVVSTGGGTITSEGFYTAPSTSGTYQVRATSVADVTKSGTATVSVMPGTPISVTLSPTTSSLLSGKQKLFTTTVTGTANTAVTWSIQEGAAGGTVSSTGLYTAPVTAGTYHVVATSQADSLKSATATITVNARAYGSISGTVTYSGVRTGRIYVTAFKSNSPLASGTSVAGPGPFVLRGLPAGSGYNLVAHMDSDVTYGGPTATVPYGEATSVSTGSTTAVINLQDYPAAAPSAHKSLIVSPMTNGAIVSFDALSDWEADRYRIFWGTTPNPDAATALGSITIPAKGFLTVVVKGLTNLSTYYFSVAGVCGTLVGPIKSSGGVVIGPPPGGAGTATLSGVVAASGGSPAGTLTVLARTESELKKPSAVYGVRIATPAAPQTFAIGGVPTNTGLKQVFAFYDRNDDGVLQATEPSNLGVQPIVGFVGGMPSTVPSIRLPVTSAEVRVTTAYLVGTEGTYSLDFMVLPGLKVPVRASLNSGPGVPAVVDIPLSGFAGSLGISFEAATKPAAFTSYSVNVEFADGTSQTLSASVDGVFQTPPGLISPPSGGSGVSRTPTFTWSPAPGTGNPAQPKYILQLFPSSGTTAIWEAWTGNTSLTFNADGSATLATLAPNTLYLLTLSAISDAGDYVSSTHSFITTP